MIMCSIGLAELDLNGKRTRLVSGGGREDQPGSTPMPVGVAITSKLPDRLGSLVPANFQPAYFLFVTNTIGTKRISLFALGSAP